MNEFDIFKYLAHVTVNSLSIKAEAPITKVRLCASLNDFFICMFSYRQYYLLLFLDNALLKIAC